MKLNTKWQISSLKNGHYYYIGVGKVKMASCEKIVDWSILECFTINTLVIQVFLTITKSKVVKQNRNLLNVI